MSEVEVSQWSVSAELRDPALEYNRFEEICGTLGLLHREVNFAIGDALLLGPRIFGDVAYQALELLNLSERRKLDYLRVAEKVPPSLRRQELSYSHHRAVAALPDYEERRKALERAAEDGLSHHRLREVLRDTNGAHQAEVCPTCGKRI